MERNEPADKHICLLNFNIEYSLVIEGLSLDHFSVMDSHSEKNRVHYLTQNKLNDLILKSLSKNHNSDNPCEHVNSVSNYIVS